MKLTNNRLRVKHFPQIPCEGFTVEVQNEREAYLIRETLADQHLFLYDNNFIPDYSNIILIEMWDEDIEPDDNGEKWCDYYNEFEYFDWDKFIEEFSDYINGLAINEKE